MKRIQLSLVAIALVMLGGYLVSAQQAPAPAAPAAPIPAGLPEWAYTPPPPPVPGAPPPTPAPPPADDGTVHRVGGSVGLTMTQIRNQRDIPDWWPEEHGPMPTIVRSGKQGATNVIACGFCHLANGRGRPENAGPAGLPAAYIMQQMEDFKNGLRDSADPRKNNTNLMIGFAKTTTPEEDRAAAEYFASLPFPRWIRVIETATVPTTRIQGGMFMALEGPAAGTEPIGNRIIETPENRERVEMRDGHTGFIAYVPVGSIRKGEALAAKAQCALCHGPNLGGIGPVPPIAGRSPSYTMRQLFDFQVGTRRGLWSDLMKPVVAKLTNDDMLNLAAYAASRMPPGEATRQSSSR